MSTNRQQGNMSKWVKCCHKTVANSSSNQTRLGHQNRVQKIHKKYQKISEKILNKVYKQIAKSKWLQTNHAQSSRAGIKRLLKRCMTDYRWLAGQRGVCTTLPREDRGWQRERERGRQLEREQCQQIDTLKEMRPLRGRRERCQLSKLVACCERGGNPTNGAC